MNLVETPEIVNWPQCHYVYLEKIGPFQNTASKAWETLQQLVPGISENNKITKFFSLYKMSEKSIELELQLRHHLKITRRSRAGGIRGRKVQPL